MRTKQQIKNIKTWVRALRSGEYKQAEEALCEFTPDKGDAFCCLGVAADVVIGGTWKRPSWAGDGAETFHWDFTSADGKVKKANSVLPQETLDDLFGPGLLLDQLTAMNDGTEWWEKGPEGYPTGQEHNERKRGFRGIAQHIERVTGVKA